MSNYQSLLCSNIYQVYVRNHTIEGTFQAFQKDLDRIQELGCNIIYLLPIHPIGKLNRKGGLGSPYAISDYRAINEELGTIEDFRELIQATHERGMKIMMDIVYHHTSYESVLSKTHPEYFVHKADGSFGNKVGDWSDIIDFDFNNQELQQELIDILLFYARLGVDGYRCDVAPLIPLSFWVKAKKALLEVNPNFFMLSESVDPGFIKYMRSRGYTAHSDAEMYQAFDILYDYDAYYKLKDYFLGKSPLEDYLEKLRMQEYIYPANYLKIHFLENHDQVRIASLTSGKALKNITAFSLFAKGVGFIFAGQEVQNDHLPDLFNKDLISFANSDPSFTNFIKKLLHLRKDGFYEGTNEFTILPSLVHKDTIVAYYGKGEQKLVGLFNLSSREEKIDVSSLLEDGVYQDSLHGQTVTIQSGTLLLKDEPLILLSKMNQH